MTESGDRRYGGAISVCIAAVLTLCWLVSLPACHTPGPSRPALRVFAAASLTDLFEALVDSFQAKHPGISMSLHVASTATLARQIEQGAAADVFVSASSEWLDHLRSLDLLLGESSYPATNRLVVTGRGDVELDELADLRRFDNIALADPHSVPAGIYAREGLQCAGLWEALEAQIVATIDVRAAVASLRTGAADAAIVYASDLVVDPSLRVLLAWPAECHPAIRYGIAVVARTRDPALSRAFVSFVSAGERASLWRAYGFETLSNGR